MANARERESAGVGFDERVRSIVDEQLRTAGRGGRLGDMWGKAAMPYNVLTSAPALVTQLQNLDGAWGSSNDHTVRIVHGRMVEVILHGLTAFSGSTVLTAVPILWDGVEIMRTHLFVNVINQHLAYPGIAATLQEVAPGFHTLTIDAVVSGTSDSNDHANLTIYDHRGPLGV